MRSDDDEQSRTVGDRLQKVRISKGMRQEDVAKALNCSKSTISSYERGHTTPDIETLQRYCELFAVSADYLIGIPYSVPDMLSLMSGIKKLIDIMDKEDCFAFLTLGNAVVQRLQSIDNVDRLRYRVRKKGGPGEE